MREIQFRSSFKNTSFIKHLRMTASDAYKINQNYEQSSWQLMKKICFQYKGLVLPLNPTLQTIEAVPRNCSEKKVFLKISQNS